MPPERADPGIDHPLAPVSILRRQRLLVHLGNVAHGGASDVMAMLVSVTLLGLLWGGLFVLARNLWVVAANHAAWNFTILLGGVPLSFLGLRRPVAA